MNLLPKRVCTSLCVFVALIFFWNKPLHAANATTHPDASNTGPTGTLLSQTGNMSLGDGQTLQNTNLTGCVNVIGSNVTIRNVKITCGGGNAAINLNGSGHDIVIENAEITMPAGQGVGIYIGAVSNVTVKAANISRAGDIIMLNNPNGVTIQDSWLHDPQLGGHVDVIQVVGGKNITITNNTLQLTNGTASGGNGYVANVMGKADLGPIDNLTIDNNFSQGGSAPYYCMAGNDPQNSNSSGSFPAPTNCHITNNTIVSGSFTYITPLIVNQGAGELINCNKLTDGTNVQVARNDRGAGIFTSQCTGSVSPTVTTAVSPTPDASCALKSSGDADCNGKVSLADYSLWRSEFQGLVQTKKADFNSSNTVTLADYSIWRTTYIGDLGPATVTNTPTPVASTGFPDATNTGPLTAPSKTWPQSAAAGLAITVSDDADGFIFNGCVQTGRAGVKITNSEIRGNCAISTLTDRPGGGTFEHNNIFDVGGHGASAIGCGVNSRFFRNNMKGAADGAKESTNCQILENYIHDLSEYVVTGGGTHNDGVQIESGATTGMLIKGNTFENTCGKSGITGQGCAGTVFINNGAAGNTVDGNYVKRWDGPTAGFIFHTSPAGINTIKNNVLECANITGFGATSGGPSIYTNNTCK